MVCTVCSNEAACKTAWLTYQQVLADESRTDTEARCKLINFATIMLAHNGPERIEEIISFFRIGLDQMVENGREAEANHSLALFDQLLVSKGAVAYV